MRGAIIVLLGFLVACSAPPPTPQAPQSPPQSKAPEQKTAIVPPPTPAKPKKSNKEIKIEKALKYLDDVEEIEWWRVEENTVYIGLNTIPDDLGLVVKFAALNGNKAIDSGCHAWAVHKDAKENPTSAWYLTATARHGKITKISRP